jgi:uncharacterized protein YqjF (DUF2071 family)
MGPTDASQPKVFLTAEWRFLAMLNYEISPDALASYVPAGTELDFWNGRTYLSLVGFLFCNTRIKGVPVPFHRHFEEVNLRFYVRRPAEEGWRRGVVFIKEIVPKRAVAFIARTIYNENYVALPMKHQWETAQNEIKSVSYHWRFEGRDNFLKVVPRGPAQPPSNGSLQEFITEHYWGYAKQRDNSTMEYRVEHPRWNVWETQSAEFSCDTAKVYGKNFCEYLDCAPASAFLADGSAVKVYKGVRLNG